jgi:hypothetical protein
MKCLLVFPILISLSVIASGTTVFDFEAQTSHGCCFDGSTDSPLVIGIATFTGGEVLGPEAGSVDLTHVYATTNLVSGAYTNPLVINFSSPVTGVSLYVTNNDPDTFTVADNVGDSESLTLGLNAYQLFTLGGTGITQVTISEAGGSWDFAIDNVGANATPEPGTLVLLGASLAAIAFRKRGFLKARS